MREIQAGLDDAQLECQPPLYKNSPVPTRAEASSHAVEPPPPNPQRCTIINPSPTNGGHSEQRLQQPYRTAAAASPPVGPPPSYAQSESQTRHRARQARQNRIPSWRTQCPLFCLFAHSSSSSSSSSSRRTDSISVDSDSDEAQLGLGEDENGAMDLAGETIMTPPLPSHNRLTTAAAATAAAAAGAVTATAADDTPEQVPPPPSAPSDMCTRGSSSSRSPSTRLAQDHHCPGAAAAGPGGRVGEHDRESMTIELAGIGAALI